MRHLLLAVAPVLLLSACGDKEISLGQGSPADARFIADLFTWDCQTDDTGGSTVAEWQGVYAYQLSLEYAPDDLAARSLPASGCTKGLDLFPTDAGAGGVDLDGTPSWSFGEELGGSMTRKGAGFYFDNAFRNQNTCNAAEDMLAEGTLLENAGGFSGARTPSAGSFEDVRTSNELNQETGLTFGEDITVEWSAESWEESWVQVRRESAAGELQESVTCNTTGSQTFDVDSDVWGLFNSAIATDVTNLYVAVQSTGTSTAEDGQKIETLTRAIHVAVIHE